jgi:hypothetical protein
MSLSRQAFNRLKPGIPRITYPGYLLNVHQPVFPYLGKQEAATR